MNLKLENIISGHQINSDDADWLRAVLEERDRLAKDASKFRSALSQYASRGNWSGTGKCYLGRNLAANALGEPVPATPPQD